MNLRQALIFFITETDENLRCKQDTPARIYSRKLRKMSQKKTHRRRKWKWWNSWDIHSVHYGWLESLKQKLFWSVINRLLVLVAYSLKLKLDCDRDREYIYLPYPRYIACQRRMWKRLGLPYVMLCRCTCTLVYGACFEPFPLRFVWSDFFQTSPWNGAAQKQWCCTL